MCSQAFANLLADVAVPHPDIVPEESGYRQAEEAFLRLLEHGFDLGSEGRVSWSRDEVHER